MARKTIYDTIVLQTAGARDTAEQVIRYLLEHPDIYVPGDMLNRIYQNGLRLPTAINQVFNHLYTGEYIAPSTYPSGIFAPVYVPKNEAVSTVLSSSADIVLDLKQIYRARALESMKQFHEKVLINLSPWLSVVNSPSGKSYNVADIHAVHGLYVRGALCASYQDSDGWLTMELGTFLAKSYALILGSIIGNMFNLTLVEQIDIMAPLTMFFCQAMSSSRDDLAHPVLFNRCTFLGNQVKLSEFMERMSSISKDGLTVSSMCQLIVEMGPARLQSFTPSLLYRLIAGLGPTILQSRIALEYPPYWVHLILLAISNVKLGMASRIKSERLAEEAKRFAFSLNTCQAFLGALER